MDELKELYSSKGRADKFSKESPSLRTVLEEASKRLVDRYKIVKPFDMGGTGIVFKILDCHSRFERVLKLSRPIFPEDFTADVVKSEGLKLRELRHQNIVDLFEVDSFEYSKGRHAAYTITEFVPGGNWEEALYRSFETNEVPSDALDLTLKILHDVVQGLRYLHAQGFVHMDVKPSNILLTVDGTARVSDLGFAKNVKGDPSTDTNIGFSTPYAHPDILSFDYQMAENNRARAAIKRKEFRFEWDLYSLGQSLLEVLGMINRRYEDKAVHRPKFRYLHLMACRMLDGRNSAAFPPRFFEEHAAGLPITTFTEIKYRNMEEINMDVEKELGIWSPTDEIMELNVYSRETIRGAESQSTVLSNRLRQLIGHPLLARLNRVSQLGLVRFLYPTASHSRFDHLLGTYTNACAYIDALYHDDNPFFRQLINQNDMQALMLASLLHDLGQYPCAHDLEEVDASFNHVLFTEKLLDQRLVSMRDQSGLTLGQVIESKDGWNVRVSDILDILKASAPERFSMLQPPPIRARLLSTIIDGPIDADKTDYLVRDSTECRLRYGLAIDFERLMKTITIAYDENTEKFQLAIYDKGRPCAESIALSRYLMFASVYWHHTSRSYKAMLQYAFKLVLNQFKRREQREAFTNEFLGFITDLKAPPRRTVESLSSIHVVIESGSSQQIAESDMALLDFLYQRAPIPAKEVLESLASRRLYKRLTTVHYSTLETKAGTSRWDIFQKISEDWDAKLKLSEALQAKLLVEVRARARGKTSQSLSEKKMTRLDELMSSGHQSILIDVPPKKDAGPRLSFVKETMEDRYLDHPREELSMLSEVWMGPIQELFNSISDVRIFCHGEVRDTIRAVLDADSIAEMTVKELKRSIP